MCLPEVCRILASNMKLYQMLSGKSMYSSCHRIRCLVTTVKIPSNDSNNLMRHTGLTWNQNCCFLNQTSKFQNMFLFKVFWRCLLQKYDILAIVYKNQLSISQNRHVFLTHNSIHLDDSFAFKRIWPACIKKKKKDYVNFFRDILFYFPHNFATNRSTQP